MPPGILDLLDWKRRVFELYAEVRAVSDPAAAWVRWRETRDELFGSHPQSPLPDRAAFRGLDYFPYDRDLRVLADVEPAAPEPREIAGSAGSTVVFTRFALARLRPRRGAALARALLARGLRRGHLRPVGDATNGDESYGPGRYVLDSVKGADLGMEDGRLVLDFNFAYNPSCSYDDRWACPLCPPPNRLRIPIRAGERV